MRANKNISNSKKLRAKSSINRNLFKKDEKKKNSNNIILEHEEEKDSNKNSNKIKVFKKVKGRDQTPLKNNSNIKSNKQNQSDNKKKVINNIQGSLKDKNKDQKLNPVGGNKKKKYNKITKVTEKNKETKKLKEGNSESKEEKTQNKIDDQEKKSEKDKKENKKELNKVTEENDENLKDNEENNNSNMLDENNLEQIKEKDEEIKKLNQLNLELNSKIDLLQKENTELNENKNRMKELESQIESLKKENKENKDSISKYEIEIKKLKSKLDSSKEEKNKLTKNKKKIEELSKQIDSLKKENSKLKKNKNENKINQLNSQKETLKKENIVLNSKTENAKKEIKELNTQKDSYKKENIDLKSKYENKIKELNSKIETLEKENKDLISKYENKANTQINSHKKENKDSSSKNEDKINQLNIKIGSLQNENNELASKNGELEAEIINLQGQIKNLNEQLTKIKKVNPFILYSSPTLIGLNNIGATCFMNSTLQCLSQTKALTNYFLNENNKERIINNNIALENKNNNQLSPIYLELIQKLWEIDGPKSFSPKTFMNTVEKMNPLFKQGQAGDTKDFIIFILEQLHKELKQINNVIDQNDNLALNQYDKNSALNYFFNDFKKEGSIISGLFFGFNETTNECLNCKNIYNSQNLINPICYNYGIFNCLIFPLEEVKNMKNNSMQYTNMQINNNRVTLYECFIYNQKVDFFTGENRNYCNICKQLFDSNYISKIFISPNILIMILNRGRGNIYDVKLDFSETIDITQFVQQRDCPQLIYNLYGVITHIGQSGPNAHFVASCKSPIDNKWYRYNDAFVNPISDLQKEVIDFGTPYILFYQKNNS